MILVDVNVLVYAHREGAPDHERYRGWLLGLMRQDEEYGMSELVLSGFIRVVTNRRISNNPTPLDIALRAADDVITRPNCRTLRPGPKHWRIFTRLCRDIDAVGNDVPDAYHAALAIEHGCEWVTTDKGFARFKGLRWRHPLD
jgi:toxin-antitoxin system PIN domain toxin